jgi:bifunctional non-homologous end joining protein LigD
MPDPKEIIEVNGREVVISNPGKLYFPSNGITKLDIVRYYLSVADGALRGVAGRPMVLKRYVNGAEGEAFFQKRAPSPRPAWIDTVELRFPSGRTAQEVVVTDAAGLAWVANLGCIDLNPHPVRAADLEHPDELRVDLDPVPGVPFRQTLDVALVARETLADFGLNAWPKTSGSRGFHIYAPILPRWTFTQVRACAVALAREIERRAPDQATARWWKEERHGVFVDYNQNAKDRTVASAYSIRPARQRQDEAPRVQPSRRRAQAASEPTPSPGDGLTGRRRSVMPLIEVARAASRAEALAGLDRWKERHPGAAAMLEPADILVDSMRGRSSTWTRIRLNLRNIPPDQRPPQEALEVDYDPWGGKGDPRRLTDESPTS